MSHSRVIQARLAALAITAALALASASEAAAAKACAATMVSARGEPAPLEWIARTKARANWRRKVRALPELGVAYSDWGAAEAATERCIKAERSTYCVFAGIPCRRG